MSEFKISLKAARVNAGLSQEEAASQVGVSRQTITNYETGKTAPDIKTLRKLADLYAVNINRISFLPNQSN